MPAQANVAIRAHQTAMEKVGLIPTLDSAGLTVVKNQESAGQIATVRLNDRVIAIVGKSYNDVTGVLT